MHVIHKTAKTIEKEAENLSAELYVCIEAKIMLTTNLWDEVGLANGSMGIIHNMSWDLGLDVSSMSSVILVKFNGYDKPAFPDCEDGIVPIYLVI